MGNKGEVKGDLPAEDEGWEAAMSNKGGSKGSFTS